MSRNSVYLSTGGQPYGFGGKERQKLGRTVGYDFLARQYDPVLCRFTTRDPLAETYYDISPYVYCSGDPVSRVDPDGCKIEIKGSQAFIDSYNDTREWLRLNGCDQLLTELENNEDIVITIIAGNDNWFRVNSKIRGMSQVKTGTISWNPDAFVIVSDDKVLLSPSVTLMHEIDHASMAVEDYDNYNAARSSQVSTEIFSGLEVEKRAVMKTEYYVARMLGEIGPDEITRRNSLGHFYGSTIGMTAREQSIKAGRFNSYNNLPRVWFNIKITP